MRKLIYFIACTVDGFIARKDGSFDFFPTAGEHFPYIISHYPETIPGHLWNALGVHGTNSRFDTVLMGRSTYEVGSAIGITSPYPHLKQYVVSRTMVESSSADVQIVSTDPIELVRGLKQQSGLDIWLCGGARLAGAVYDEVDEIILKVNPVVLGEGIPLFHGARGPMRLELTEHSVFAGGVAILRYDVSR